MWLVDWLDCTLTTALIIRLIDRLINRVTNEVVKPQGLKNILLTWAEMLVWGTQVMRRAGNSNANQAPLQEWLAVWGSEVMAPVLNSNTRCRRTARNVCPLCRRRREVSASAGNRNPIRWYPAWSLVLYRQTCRSFDVLLTVHLSIIFAVNQLNAQNLLL